MPRHTTPPRHVFVLAQPFAIVFLWLKRKKISFSFICVKKSLQVSTCFFSGFQVNQKLTNFLDFCNHKLQVHVIYTRRFNDWLSLLLLLQSSDCRITFHFERFKPWFFFLRCPSFIASFSLFTSFGSVSVFFCTNANVIVKFASIDTRADSLGTFKSNRYFCETFTFTFLLFLLCVNFFPPICKRAKPSERANDGGRNKSSSHFLHVRLENHYSLMHTDRDGAVEKKVFGSRNNLEIGFASLITDFTLIQSIEFHFQ